MNAKPAMSLHIRTNMEFDISDIDRSKMVPSLQAKSAKSLSPSSNLTQGPYNDSCTSACEELLYSSNAFGISASSC